MLLRTKMRLRWKVIKICSLLALVTFYCQYVIFYVSLIGCDWPLVKENEANNYSNVMFISDVHIQGAKGYFTDKLFHEWQMYRSFQSAIQLFKPSHVFILGDIFDEGEVATQEQYESYIRRFKQIFLGNIEEKDINRLTSDSKLYSIVGNHDIGFHYTMTRKLKSRFETTFNTDSVQLIQINGINFVTLNSVTMEGDNCELCAHAQHKLFKLGKMLCPTRSETHPNPKECEKNRPILLTHFPLFRESDKDCDEPDEAPESLRFEKFKEKWDCLSNNATQLLFATLNPRLVLNGHVHFGCVTLWHKNVYEWTVASFNWRNIHSPSFLLAKISGDNHAIRKCILPNQITVIIIYISTICIILFCLRKEFKHCYRKIRESISKKWQRF